MKNRRRSILKGAAAGFVGGVAGAAAAAYLDRGKGKRGSQAPLTLTPEGYQDEAAGSAVESGPPDPVPWVFGGLAGAAYGAAVEMEPSGGGWKGAAFGLAVNRISESGIFPMAGLNAKGHAWETETKIGRRLKFAVFGIVSEFVRRGVRRGLG
jgi:putative membrane protein